LLQNSGNLLRKLLIGMGVADKYLHSGTTVCRILATRN
jgi:hypothetical protein